MARCLIIGCGCRGASLARELTAAGHVVRGTTRDRARTSQIEAAGAQAVVGDPDRIATIAPAFEHVAVAVVLLGSAVGAPDELTALHGSRLDMLLTRMVDTTVRGIVYEGAGTVDPALLGDGAARVQRFCADARIPCAIIDVDAADHRAWLESGLGAVRRVLGEED